MIKQQEFETRIKNRFPDEHFTIIEYNGSNGFLKIQCDNCKIIIEVSHAHNFLGKNKIHGCKYCKGYIVEREKKLNEIKQLYDIIDTEVKNTHTYYTIKCKSCGHIRNSTLNNLYKHLQCGCITNCLRNRTPQEFIDEVNRKNNDYYELVGPYIDQSHKVLLKHQCGFIWKVWPSDMVDGRMHSCPQCQRKQSAGQRYICEWLTKHNIKFKTEKTLNNSRLRFDFYIESLNLAIEYQGKQHYIPSDYFGKENFKLQQERDERKRNYCKENGIQLIEIEYTLKTKEIENVLSNIFQSSTTKVDSSESKKVPIFKDDDIVSSHMKV